MSVLEWFFYFILFSFNFIIIIDFLSFPRVVAHAFIPDRDIRAYALLILNLFRLALQGSVGSIYACFHIFIYIYVSTYLYIYIYVFCKFS